MDNGAKQRVIGACVLLAVGVIFLPSLLSRPERQAIDTTTQIPPMPDVPMVTLSAAEPPANVAAPPTGKQLFQPKDQDFSEVASTASTSVDSETEQVSASNSSSAEESRMFPPLGRDNALGRESGGLPKSWVIQVGSFSEAPRAEALVERLQSRDYRAYSRPTENQSNPLHRVFVGPAIEYQMALAKKRELDALLDTETLVLRFTP